MAAPSKKRKFVEKQLELKFPDVVIFIAPEKIQKMRLKLMTQSAVKKGFNIKDQFGPEVTHVVTEVTEQDKVLKNLQLTEWDSDKVMVNTLWFSECLKEGQPVEVTERHRIPRGETTTEKKDDKHQDFRISSWACQRSTPLKHHNEKFVKALEVLEQHAELRAEKGESNDYSRALAFHRASCVLKSFPKPVTSVTEARKLKDIGSHAQTVIRDILEHGYCVEVDEILASEEFKTWKVFDGVFGIGAETAKLWYNAGYRTIQNIIDSDDAPRKADPKVQYGLAFYDDLNTPVLKNQAERIQQIVTNELNKLLPGVTVQLTGGFRRGKDTGHDLDLLISHPEEGKETGVLNKLLQVLTQKSYILFGRHETHNPNKDVWKETAVSQKGMMDNFEKWMGMFKLPANEADDGEIINQSVVEKELNKFSDTKPDLKTLVSVARSKRNWSAHRVDLIVTPVGQYYYALVGWTGSKHFNRSIRLYAQRVLGMKLTSHGLYSSKENKHLSASSERKVFEHLNLPYREPWERNC